MDDNIKKEYQRQNTTMEQDIRVLGKEISDLESAADEPDRQKRRLWNRTIRERRDELRSLRSRLREQENIYREQKLVAHLKLNSQALNTAYEEAKEKRTQIQDWEDGFMDIEVDLLFKIVEAANVLEIKDLLEHSCKRAARLVKEGSLKTLKGLPSKVQAQVAQSLTPHAFLRAAEAKIIPVSHPEQILHAQIWASISPSDTWFEAALSAGANPVLNRQRP